MPDVAKIIKKQNIYKFNNVSKNTYIINHEKFIGVAYPLALETLRKRD